jgi:hypothetical protein
VVIEHNLAHDNQTGGRYDGGGFDLDRNTSHCAVQYNLSYGNDGPGYLLYSGKPGGAGNVVRFNISVGDVASAERYGGISVLGSIADAAIYQNTVLMARRADGRPALALSLGRPLRAVTVRNNIFVTAQPGPLVSAAAPLPGTAALLQGNDYFAPGGRWLIWWGDAPYYSLAAWQAATGQETMHSRATGMAVDPELTGPVLGTPATRPGSGGARFRLRAGSPLAGAGLDLARLYGLHGDLLDYSGRPASTGAPNVGAG